MSLSKEYLKYILELLFGLDDKTYRLDLDRIDCSNKANQYYFWICGAEAICDSSFSG